MGAVKQSARHTVVRLPLMVNTTALVIVVFGLCERDLESKNPNDCDGDGVIEGSSEDVEEGTEPVELFSWEVVDGGVVESVWEEGSEVDGDVVGVDSSVLLLGDWPGGGEGDSLSAQISRQILGDRSVVHTVAFQKRDQGMCSRRYQKMLMKKQRLELAWAIKTSWDEKSWSGIDKTCQQDGNVPRRD